MLDVDLSPAGSLTGEKTALAGLFSQAHDYAHASRSSATWRAYASDWRHFANWCAAHDLQALPAKSSTLSLYLTDLATRYKVATIERRLASISQMHQLQGHTSPTSSADVRTVFAGVRREHRHPQKQKDAMVTSLLRLVVAALPESIAGQRDRALILVGFASALRRSEIAALDVANVEEAPEGLVLTVLKSKTDQEGHSRRIGIPYGSSLATCPVRSLRSWLKASGISEGALFRGVDRHGNVTGRLSGHAVAAIIQRSAARAGLDAQKFAGHSLRSGLATSAATAGVSERIIMKQTGHRSVQMVRKYIREGELFTANAAAQVGL